jgi:hypothetical protein
MRVRQASIANASLNRLGMRIDRITIALHPHDGLQD